MKIRNIILSAVLTAGILFSAGCGKSGKPDLSEGAEVVSGASSVGNLGDITLTDGDLVAVFDIKGYGTITAKLFPESAPVGVDNFKQLADSHFFDGLKIHRVVADFMFQGGSLNGDGTGGDAMVNDGSFGIETDLDNARHFYGALCYANAMGNNSTQFYIVNNNDPQDLNEMSSEQFLSVADQYAEAAESYTDVPDALAYYKFYEDYYRTTAAAFDSASDEVKAKYAEVGGTPSLDGNYTVFGQVYNGFDVIEKISAAEVEANESGEESKPVQEIIINSVNVYEFSSAE